MAARANARTGYALRRIVDGDGVKLYRSGDSLRVEVWLGVIPFTGEAVAHARVAAALSIGGIGGRNGCFCAPLCVGFLDVGAAEYRACRRRVAADGRSALLGSVGISFGFYNTCDHVDWVLEMVERVMAGEYTGNYVVDRASGSYFPQEFESSLVADHSGWTA